MCSVVHSEDVADVLIIFVIAKVGFSGSLIFYDSMMVDVTTDERMERYRPMGMRGAISEAVYRLSSVYCWY